MRGMTLAAALALWMAAAPLARADDPVGVVERLGEPLPRDLVLTDEAGVPVKLSGLVDRPTILALVYFRCAGICSPLLNGLSQIVDRTGLVPGKDFQVLTVSFDPRDTPELAKAKRANYLAGLPPAFPAQAWRFLTGDAATTKRLADAVGFGFRPLGEDFIHPAVLTVLTPDGRVARYVYGVTFLPFDVKMALLEASRGRTMATSNRVLQLCYSYDANGRRYGLDLTRIGAIFTLAALALFGAVILARGRRREERQP
jgi:protein SCO1